MIELSLNKLQKYYGANIVLRDVTFDVQTLEKVGIVGINGCGKSSLLKIIMGLESYENGTISIKKNSTLGYLEQMPVYPDGYKVIDVLNTAFEKIDAIQMELEEIERQLANSSDSMEEDSVPIDKINSGCLAGSNQYNRSKLLYSAGSHKELLEGTGLDMEDLSVDIKKSLGSNKSDIKHLSEINESGIINSCKFNNNRRGEVGDEKYMEKLLDRYSKVQMAYESLGGYEKEEKLSKVCSGLKINDKFKEKLFSELSGGEKTTIILGKILLQNPQILLLDEPSNHLDLETMEWLEAYLKAYKGVVLIVSHDRYFLDNVVTKIIEIEDMVSKIYYGNYTDYVNKKERQLNLQMEAFINQQKKIKAMESAISRLRDWGMRGDNEKFFKRAGSMQKFLDKLGRIDRPDLERVSMNIHVDASKRSGNDVIIIKDLSKRYDKKVLFNRANLLVRNKESVALVGGNGCGKSTLIRILLGNIEADGGTAVLGSGIKLGYLPQNIVFEDENKSIVETFRDGITITEGKAREYLAKYMFFGEAVFTKVGSLSGGERSRLKLAMLMYNEVNLLILDEPTNHLDIDSREALEGVLREFQGTLFFVSHDRYFINNIANRVVELSRGQLILYNGNYEYYKEKLSEIKNIEDTKKIAREDNKTAKAKTVKTKKEKYLKSNKNEFK